MKYFTLFCLSIAQSIPQSFFLAVMPVIMRQENCSLQLISYLHMVRIPLMFKFLWAPLVDNRARTTGSLRRWILGAETAYAVVIVLIGGLSLEADFVTIVALIALAFVASGTQDIATDTYAMMVLRPDERAMGNSMQSGGIFVGTLMGTGVMLVVYRTLGWQMLVYALAAFAMLALLPLLLVRQPAISRRQTQRASLRDLASFFRTKGLWPRLAVILFFYTGVISIVSVLKPYMVDLGYGMEQIGWVSGIGGASAGMLGSFAAGFMVRRMRLQRSLWIFWSLITAAALWFFGLSFTEPGIAALAVGAVMLWGSYGMASVAIFTFAMRHVRPGREGTDFTLQIVLAHLNFMLIVLVCGLIGDAAGYRGVFGFALCMCALTAAVIRLHNRQSNPDTIKH